MKCVFVTGATGVIGSEVVARLLQTEDCQIRLLLRANSSEHLNLRLQELFEYWRDAASQESMRARVGAVAGDVCQPRLGIEQGEYDYLCQEVTHVIHSAGNVKLNQTMEQARANAVGAMAHVLAFARACQARGRFVKADVVTTIGVAGKMPGLIPERRLTEPREFHNNYEAAKAEAEELAFQAIDEGLPITVHRPSMVVGDSRTGRIKQFQVFYYLCEFLSGSKTRGIILDVGDATLDIVPVDYVSAAICISSGDPGTAGRVFHLCSGQEYSLPLKTLSIQFRKAAMQLGIRTYKETVLPRWGFSFLGYATKIFAPGNLCRSLQTLPFFLEYLGTQQAFDVCCSASYFDSANCQLARPVDSIRHILNQYFGSKSASRRHCKIKRPLVRRIRTRGI